MLGEFGLVPEEYDAARALHRERGRSGLFVPILLNERVVLVVHAERVRLGLGLGEASIIHALVPAVTASLRRLILAAKADRQRTSLPPPEPSLEPELAEEPTALILICKPADRHTELPNATATTAPVQAESMLVPELTTPAPKPSLLALVTLGTAVLGAVSMAAAESPSMATRSWPLFGPRASADLSTRSQKGIVVACRGEGAFVRAIRHACQRCQCQERTQPRAHGEGAVPSGNSRPAPVLC